MRCLKSNGTKEIFFFLNGTSSVEGFFIFSCYKCVLRCIKSSSAFEITERDGNGLSLGHNAVSQDPSY